MENATSPRLPHCSVVPRWGRPVSWLVMPFQARFSFIFAAILALGACAGTGAHAQDADSQNRSDQPQGSADQSNDQSNDQNNGQNNGQNSSQSSSQNEPAQGANSSASSAQSSSTQSTYGVYVPLDPLAKVRYDNRWDLSLGLAYDHMKAGPNLLQGSNLGGLDMDGSYWLSRHWGIEASGRGYIGTSGAGTNHLPSGGTLKGPVVKQYFFVGGPEWLGPHNKHGAILAHVMLGGVYGNFEKDLLGLPPATFDFYSNQVAPAVIVGGHFDLNRSEHWVFRVTPDAVITHYTFTDALATPVYSYKQYDVNFAISVGVEYKFTRIKRSSKKANWLTGW
jgi:hypothetical protein